MKAIVLCAGRGTRLGELTADTPKPLLEVEGAPILSYVLGHLRSQGVVQLAINVHFRPDDFRTRFGDGSRWQLEISYSVEPQLLGTAGAVKNLDSYFRGPAPFLVHYGDILTDQDFGALERFHQQRRALLTVLVHQRQGSNSRISLDADGRILDFKERPPASTAPAPGTPWVNSGVYLVEPEVLDLIPAGVPSDWPRDIFPKLVSGGRLFAFPLAGYRCAIDSPERLEEARAAVRTGRCLVTPLK